MSLFVHHHLRPTSYLVGALMALALACTSPKSADSGGNKPSTACEEHCICVGLVCSDVDTVDGSYDTCIQRCANWSVEEMVCATEWCEPVMWTLPKSFRNHACDHSTMSSGLYVCLGYDHDTSDDGGADDTGESDGAMQDVGTLDVVVDVQDGDGASLADSSSSTMDAGRVGDVGGADGGIKMCDVISSDSSTGSSDVVVDTDVDTTDGGSFDVSPSDVSNPDSSAADGAGVDAIVLDTLGLDTAMADVGVVDVGSIDSTSIDTSAPDSGPIDSNSSDTAGAFGSITSCQEYCACMVKSCANFQGYPFTNNAACIQECKKFSKEQWACFPNWCSAVGKLTSTFTQQHTCVHAWGELGLEECDVKGWKAGPFEECLFDKCMIAASGCAKVEKCGAVGVCLSGCEWNTTCIDTVCKPKYPKAAWKAFEPVMACAKQQGCAPK